MRRNGFRVIHKELKTFYDGTRKANLDVEIAVDMLSLAGRYDTAVLVSGDEDFVYAVNAVAYKGCRVEVAGFRSNTAPKLIDVADYFIDLGEIAERVRKEHSHGTRYYDHQPHDDGPAPAFIPPTEELDEHQQQRPPHNNHNSNNHRESIHLSTQPAPTTRSHTGSDDGHISNSGEGDEEDRIRTHADFVRITDEH